MNEILIDLPTVIQAIDRTQREQNGVVQIFRQPIEITINELLKDVTFTSTNYGEIIVNDSTVIDWSLKNIQKVTLVDNTNITFLDPGGATHLSFEVLQGGSGGYTMTWPSNVDWTEGIAPGSGAVGKTVIVTFVYNGSRYRGQFTSYFT